MINTNSVIINDLSWSRKYSLEKEKSIRRWITHVRWYITNPVAATFRGDRIQRKIWHD